MSVLVALHVDVVGNDLRSRAVYLFAVPLLGVGFDGKPRKLTTWMGSAIFCYFRTDYLS